MVIANAGIPFMVLMGLTVGGCERGSSKPSTDPAVVPGQGLPKQSDAVLNRPLAQIEGTVITVGEFQEQINRQSAYVRQRYTSLEAKKDFLNSLIRFEILAKEAQKRSFDKHPDVVRAMKQAMIQKLMKDEFETKLKPTDITEDEMRRYYDSRKQEYNKPAEVRASAIIVSSKAAANRAAKEALGPAGRTNKKFRDLVDKHSTDEKTRIRGGDLRYFAKGSKDVPRAVVDRAFQLKKSQVAGPIAAAGKYYIIKITGKRKALVKKFEDVKRQIQNRMYRDKRSGAQKRFVARLKANSTIKIYNDNLAKVQVDTRKGAELLHSRPGTAPAFPANK